MVKATQHKSMSPRKATEVIGGDESSEANRGQILVWTRRIVEREQKQSLENRNNRQERAEAIVREFEQSSIESRSNR